jgi:hypothetical protein
VLLQQPPPGIPVQGQPPPQNALTSLPQQLVAPPGMVVVSQSGAVGTNAVVTSQPQQPPLVQQPQPPIPPGVLISYTEHRIPLNEYWHTTSFSSALCINTTWS